MIYPADMPDLDVMALAFVDNDLREDMTEQERTLACKEMEDAGASRTEIAEKISKTSGTVTRIMAPFDCIAEVMEAFFAGQITSGDCYTFKNAPDQGVALRMRLAGATRDEVAKATRRRKVVAESSDTKEKTTRIKIPLAINTSDVTANGVVTVASLPGQEIDLEIAEELLIQALRALKDAKKRGYSARTFSKAMKDMAEAAG